MDFEKLGAFYLGKRIDEATQQQTEDLVLYDAKDLTTHAVIIGMTGSGKTGLGIGLLEEAAIDKVPVIAIDPKGDMGNIMLTFPDFSASDFRPWINERQASDKGMTPDAYAAAQAKLWQNGIASWGQDSARVRKLKDAVDVAIYTPGSNAGVPVSVLQSFQAPAAALVDDVDLYRERVQSTATGVLSLLGINADPISSREHILLSRILDDAWQQGRSLDIAALIALIQTPPFERIGVMDLESFYPSKERFALAMRLNNLLAAPGFQSWMDGEALDTARLFYTDSGKPRISVMSIAHLSDEQRMFFVCMLLNDIIAWMRAQPGTGSLRALLYMDEIFGYLPPTANPPSKTLFLTLLKQARAFGLGLVLATQNPVDLDYKALSNAGTWFIGRLQTERDKARVMEGLEGAGSGGEFDKGAMEQTLAGLGKRRFLLHNVHEDAPVVFGTRWVMSYLSGPMTRDQISALMGGRSRPADATAPAAADKPQQQGGVAPVLPPGVKQFYAPAVSDDVTYFPRLFGAATLTFDSARYKVSAERDCVFSLELDGDTNVADWDEADKHDVAPDAFSTSGLDTANYIDPPTANAKRFAAWQKAYSRWLRANEVVTLYRSRPYKLLSSADETEGDFRIRLQLAANEKRDIEVGKLRKRYATKAATLENRLLRAQQAIEREQQQASKKKLDTAVSVGTAILGALLGRKKLSSASASKIGTAIKTAGGASKESGDVKRAQATAKKVQADLAALEQQLQQDIDALEDRFDAQDEALEEVTVKAKVSDVHVQLFGLLWVPYRDKGDGRMVIDWDA